MQFTHEIEQMCCVKKGCNHGPAPIPQEGNWTQSREITDISGLTHGVGWCAPQQGTCKLTLNVKNGIIEEALVETSGCSGMTHSAAMAAEILPGKTVLEAMNTDLVCDAINTAMRELFLQIVYGRTQSAFSDGFSSVGGFRAALLAGDGGSHHIGPAGVFKRDGLNAVHNFTGVDSLGKAELFRFFNGADAVFGQGFIDLLDAAVVGFEKRHNSNSA